MVSISGSIINLDGETAEKFAATVNKLKGQVTMIFIAHQLPRSLKVDHIVRIDAVAASGASGVAEADEEKRVR